MNSLKDIYLDQLMDLYSANKQAKEAARQLADAASNDALRDALKAGVDGIEDGNKHLEKMITGHGESPNDEHCKGMEGLVREARAHAVKEDFTNGALRDAVIVTQYQRMAHYAIAGYGCVAAFAKQLGLDDEAKTLKDMLEAAYSGDHTMTDLAENQINEAAA
ncbi:MAG: DUF892 family protein [Rhodobacterales bacterium]